MPKIYKVSWGNWRVRLSIGTKTLLAFFLIISFLAGLFYYFTTVKFSSQIEKEALSDLNLKLKGAVKLFYSRTDQMKLGMLQAASEDTIKSAIEKRDSRFLNKLLTDFGKARPYVDLWAVVDSGRKVIGRRDGNIGDRFEINGLIERALNSGVPLLSTESVSVDVIGRENLELSSKLDRAGLMQLAVIPVKSDDEVVGVFVTGILLNNYEWFPNSAYESFHVSAALNDYTSAGSSVIAASGVSKGFFNQQYVLPDEITDWLLEGKRFLGPALIDGTEAYAAVEPILNMEGKLIGGIAAGIPATAVNSHVMWIKRNALIIAAMGVVFSLFLAGLVYLETSRPIKAIMGTIGEISKGNLDVRADIKTKDEFEEIGGGLNAMAESIQVREARLDRFNELSKILIESHEPDELLKKALTRTVELTGSHIGIVYLFEAGSELLKPAAYFGVSESELRNLNIGEGMAGKCAQEKKTLVLNNITMENIPLDTGFSLLMPKDIAWFPIFYKDRLNGVFTLGTLHSYHSDEIKHIENLVNQIAIALDNAITHKQIELISHTDPLTGMFNRRYFFERFENDFARAKRYRYNLGLLMIDLDNFKQINDNNGHQQGDRVLMELSALIKANTRSTDIWARYGGEEFIGYISHSSLEGVCILAEKLRGIVEKHEFPGMEGRKITASIGISFYPEDACADIDDMIRIADERLFKAKRGGKNVVVCVNQYGNYPGVQAAG